MDKDLITLLNDILSKRDKIEQEIKKGAPIEFLESYKREIFDLFYSLSIKNTCNSSDFFEKFKKHVMLDNSESYNYTKDELINVDSFVRETIAKLLFDNIDIQNFIKIINNVDIIFSNYPKIIDDFIDKYLQKYVNNQALSNINSYIDKLGDNIGLLRKADLDVEDLRKQFSEKYGNDFKDRITNLSDINGIKTIEELILIIDGIILLKNNKGINDDLSDFIDKNIEWKVNFLNWFDSVHNILSKNNIINSKEDFDNAFDIIVGILCTLPICITIQKDYKIDENIIDSRVQFYINNIVKSSKVQKGNINENTFEKIKKVFFNKIKESYIKNHNLKLDLSNDERIELADFYSNEYPNASKNERTMILNNTKWNNLQQGFIEERAENIINELKKGLNVKTDINTLLYILSLFQDLISVAIDDYLEDDLQTYIGMNISKNFMESENNNIRHLEKENKKGTGLKEDMEDRLTISVPKIIERIILPSKLKDALIGLLGDKYNKDLEKYLIKLLNKRQGYYKKSRFEPYGIDKDNEKFFEILNKYGYIVDEDKKLNDTCSPVNATIGGIVKGDNIQDNGDDTLQKDDDLLNSGKTIDEIIKICVQDLKNYYPIDNESEFYKNLLNYSKSDQRILKGIVHLVSDIGKGLVIPEQRRRKKSKTNIYAFDVRYNTGYRIVLKKGKSEKDRIIENIFNHDDYLDYINENYK